MSCMSPRVFQLRFCGLANARRLEASSVSRGGKSSWEWSCGMLYWNGRGSKVLVLVVVLRSKEGKTPKENKVPEAEEAMGRQS